MNTNIKNFLPIFIYGCPTTGKTTFLSKVREQSKWIDSDFFVSKRFTTEENDAIKKQKPWLIQDDKNKLLHACWNHYTQAIVFEVVAIALKEEKNIITNLDVSTYITAFAAHTINFRDLRSIGFSRDSEAIAEYLQTRDQYRLNNSQADSWSKFSIKSAKLCKDYVLLNKGEFIDTSNVPLINELIIH